VGVIPNLVKADQLIREGRSVLIAGSAGRHTCRRGRWRRLLRRVKRLVEVRSGCRMMATRVVQVIQRISFLASPPFDRGYYVKQRVPFLKPSIVFATPEDLGRTTMTTTTTMTTMVE
ncbi:hypothetical protein ALC62_14460, partial [Cyphomyrmex costatus]